MNLEGVQARLARGMGRAALTLGEPYALYRPRDMARPLDPAHLRLHLKVALRGAGRGWQQSPPYGEALWNAVLDTAYSQPGDYLRGPLGTFFIASQPPLLPTLCVLTNRLLTVTRPDGALTPGLNGYGGMQKGEQMLLLEDWPASVLTAHAGGHRGGELPGTPGPASWTVLLPPNARPDDGPLAPGDLLSDDEGFAAIIDSVEENSAGWRLSAIQAVP